MSSATRFTDVLKSTLSHRERLALADLLLSKGPDAPTLCEGWNTRDLAVHLVLRESRPDAMAGMFLPVFAGHLKKVSEQLAATPYEELVQRYRQGPPLWSPLKPVDRVANIMENFVHLEDVRRAGGGEQGPRPLSAADEAVLWFCVQKMSKALLKNPSMPLVLRWNEQQVRVGPEPTGKDEVLTVSGNPQDIGLWLFGRDAVAVPNLEISAPVAFESIRRRSL